MRKCVWVRGFLCKTQNHSDFYHDIFYNVATVVIICIYGERGTYMQLDNYREYLQHTVLSYPDKVKKYLINMFLERGIAVKGMAVQTNLFENEQEPIDISGESLDMQLLTCMSKSQRAVIELEKWEFCKDYKYSVIFTCDDFPSVLEKVKAIAPIADDCENEYLDASSFVRPVSYHTGKYHFLKFNLAYAAVHPLTNEEFLSKYPFLVVFHEDGELVEFRFDVLKKVFLSDSKDANIYARFIADRIKYFSEEFCCNLSPLSLEFMVNVGKNDDKVKLIAQYMKLPSGGNAQLEVGNNKEYMMPFLGELRSLLNDNQQELEKVPDFRAAMEQFMFEMEEMSDYPWIELLWENEIKTRSNHVKFMFNYMNQSYCLIQHYYSSVLIGMERMNYVVEYIVRHRNDNTAKTE